MKFVEAFDTLRDAEICAFSFFNGCYRERLSPGNYIYYSNDVSFQMWIYFEKKVWNVIYCPPNSWHI